MQHLWSILESLPLERWPTFVRSDCDYGSEKIMREFEKRGLPYLLKLDTLPRSRRACAICCARARDGKTLARDGKGLKPLLMVDPSEHLFNECSKLSSVPVRQDEEERFLRSHSLCNTNCDNSNRNCACVALAGSTRFQ